MNVCQFKLVVFTSNFMGKDMVNIADSDLSDKVYSFGGLSCESARWLSFGIYKHECTDLRLLCKSTLTL